MFGDGVTQETIDDAGGLLALAWHCIATGCECEPCTRCVVNGPCEDRDTCDDYICLRCDAVEWLESEGLTEAMVVGVSYVELEYLLRRARRKNDDTADAMSYAMIAVYNNPPAEARALLEDLLNAPTGPLMPQREHTHMSPRTEAWLRSLDPDDLPKGSILDSFLKAQATDEEIP